MAGQALRMLLPSIQAVHPSIVEATLGLLKSPHIQIQYEGYEILRDLICRPQLQDVILVQLIAILKTTVEDVQEELPEDRRRRQKAVSEGKTLTAGQWGGLLGKTDEMKNQNEAIAASYMQQAYAAKLLGVMAAIYRELAGRMIDLQVVSGLLNVIANVGHPDSQRYAANSLLFLVENFDYVAEALREHMGQNFFEILEEKPDTFYKELSREQVRYLRRNTVQIHAAGSTGALSESETGSGSSDEEEGADTPRRQARARSAASKSRATTAGSARFPTSREGETPRPETSETQEVPSTADSGPKSGQASTPLTEGEKPEEKAPPAPLVQEMYVPLGQAAVNATFAGNKFVSSEKLDSKEKFAVDLEKLANATTSTKKDKGRKEEYQLHPETEEWLSQKKNDPEIFHKDLKMALETSSTTTPASAPRPREIDREASTATHESNEEMVDEDLATDNA
ncbi:hypothetical protein HK104_007702 [Borealophlyctis nickersoniae]|nr:hypothetical protein HK104_007702 [Borealophlyctis nickersoniae]